MTDTYYLLDNNVVSHLSKTQLASRFFEEQCRIPSEVFHEAGSRDELRIALYPTTVAVLEALRDVMLTVPPGDTSLVNLYGNKGNADPLLVACALVETRLAESLLVRPTWVVVSNDAAVRRTATDVGVESLDRKDFFASTTEMWES